MASRPITVEHMEAALRRWEDFAEVQVGIDQTELQAMLRRIKEGDSEGVAAELLGSRRDTMPDALRALGGAVDLSPNAKAAFTLGASESLEGARVLPTEIAIDLAALFGLIVGLAARQLADEESRP